MNIKDTNPKDLVGATKVSASCIPRTVLAEVALALMEGARKYGRHNYRVTGIRASIYYDAVQRHLDAWWEGQDIDPDSGISHLSKAIAGLIIMRDAMINSEKEPELFNDDRPPPVDEGFWVKVQQQVDILREKYPESLPPNTK